MFKGPPIYSVGSAAVTPDGGFIFPGTIKRGDVTKFQLMKLSPSVNIPPVERTLTDIRTNSMAISNWILTSIRLLKARCST
ncbi:hypothetical protein [Paenibacillus sp. FSL W7-1332]|uniref:hypothetical protein n=1 Tax=Paenibacillus sp. FSL W7-1332 TaxID=2921702 RepID=UPI0030D57926